MSETWIPITDFAPYRGDRYASSSGDNAAPARLATGSGRVATALLVLLALTPMPDGANAAQTNETVTQAERVISGMTSREFAEAARRWMPAPILRIFHRREMGVNKYAIELDLSGVKDAPSPQMRVTFETAENSGKADLLDAIFTASMSARKSLEGGGPR